MNTLNSINIKALNAPIDNSTESIIRFKRGDDIAFRVAIFKDDETLASLDDILSLHFEIYNIGNYQSPSPRTFETLLQKTISAEDINTDLSLDDWNNEVSQHATFEVAPEESALEYGEKWLRISAKTQDFKYLTLSAGWIEVEENYSTYETASIEDIQTWKNAAQESAETAQAVLEEIQSEITQIESLQDAVQETLANAEVAAQEATTAVASIADAVESTSAAAEQTASDLAEIQELKVSIIGTTTETTAVKPTITLSSSVTSNKTYILSTLTSLTIASVEGFEYEAKIFFSSGSTATIFTYPSTLDTIGSVTINANTSYAISICNNIMVIGALN